MLTRRHLLLAAVVAFVFPALRTPAVMGADEAASNIINVQLDRAREIVTRDRDSIARLVELLLEQDTVEAEDIRRCFDPTSVTFVAPAQFQPTTVATM